MLCDCSIFMPAPQLCGLLGSSAGPTPNVPSPASICAAKGASGAALYASVGTDPVGTDPVGTDPVGTDPHLPIALAARGNVPQAISVHVDPHHSAHMGSKPQRAAHAKASAHPHEMYNRDPFYVFDVKCDRNHSELWGRACHCLHTCVVDCQHSSPKAGSRQLRSMRHNCGHNCVYEELLPNARSCQ